MIGGAGVIAHLLKISSVIARNVTLNHSSGACVISVPKSPSPSFLRPEMESFFARSILRDSTNINSNGVPTNHIDLKAKGCLRSKVE